MDSLNINRKTGLGLAMTILITAVGGFYAIQLQTQESAHSPYIDIQFAQYGGLRPWNVARVELHVSDNDPNMPDFRET